MASYASYIVYAIPFFPHHRLHRAGTLGLHSETRSCLREPTSQILSKLFESFYIIISIIYLNSGNIITTRNQ